MFIKIVRTTRDAEMASTPAGKRLMKLSFVYDIGWGENKKPQFVDGALWGDRGDKIAQYLPKGTQFQVIADDLESYTYQKSSGETVAAMRCRVIDVVLCGGKQDGGAHGSQQAPQAAQQRTQAPQQQRTTYTPEQQAQHFPDSFDDDIAF